MTKLPGNWWLDYGSSSGVWPCDVLRPSIAGHVVVIPTHKSAPDYGKEITVPSARVFDSRFNRPSWPKEAA